MPRKTRLIGKPIIGISCEVIKLRPYYSEFELACDYHYVRSILRGGGIPLMLPINHNLRDIVKIVRLIDGLLIIGGADIPPTFYGERSRHKIKPMYRGRIRFDMRLYWIAQRMKLPILCICYGMQLLNVIYGGTLYQDIRKQVRGAKNHQSTRYPMHHVHLNAKAVLAKVFKRRDFMVHSQHHQAVKKLGHSLRAVGYSPDGIVEAIEGPPQTLAVQWHPERQDRDPIQKQLFRRFVALCRKRRKNQI